jgi:hypothetical protein
VNIVSPAAIARLESVRIEVKYVPLLAGMAHLLEVGLHRPADHGEKDEEHIPHPAGGVIVA